MKPRIVHMIPVAVAWALLAVIATGCASTTLRYRDGNRALTRENVVEIARETDLGEVGKASASEAQDLRTQALTELRSHGQDAQRLADALTAQLPSDYAGVPVYVEAANVEGRACWIVVEARPASDSESRLSSRRYWVFDRDDFAVVESGTLP
ncbi:MAG: hypothetical protein N3B11_00775 [Coriobacteriia bacterium]|nr:hypothetical protein [Coriobacteriia bacterium]